MTQIHPGASITLTDATGVPLAEIPIRHAYDDGESITAALPIQVTRQAEDALLAGILRRLLDHDVTHWDLERTTFQFRGALPLTHRETRWLNRHYPPQ